MKYICVFCGSQKKAVPKYRDAIEVLAKHIVNNGYGLVYGGGNVGLMKAIADAVKKLKGEIVGIVTPEIVALDVVEKDIKLELAPTYAARKEKMIELSDGFISLPGGLGTNDEAAYVMIKNQFASYENKKDNPLKPLVMLNLDNFYEGLQLQLIRELEEEFITEAHFKMVKFVDNPLDAVMHIKNFRSPIADPTKWWDKDKKLANLSIKLSSPIHASDLVKIKMDVTPSGDMVVKLDLNL